MRLQKCLTGIILFLAGTSALAGPGSTGGGDVAKLGTGSAWFLGAHQTIRICYEKADDFGASNELIESKFKAAFDTWKTYLTEKQVFNYSSAFDGTPDIRPTMTYTISKSCTGKEDLTLFLGVVNRRVREGAKNFNHPLSFVYRENYDMTAGWGRGFMWLISTGKYHYRSLKDGPDWTLDFTLQGTFLHELGHILGCEHVSGTAMDADLVSRVMDQKHVIYPDLNKWSLINIDQSRELAQCYECNLDYDGQISGEEDDESRRQTFQLFAGRAPVGAIHAHVSFTYSQSVGPTSAGTITYRDSQGTVSIPFSYASYGIKLLQSEATIFYTLMKVPSLPKDARYVMSRSSPVAGWEHQGTVRDAAGNTRVILILQNGSAYDGPALIRYIDPDSTSHDLFTTNFWD